MPAKLNRHEVYAEGYQAAMTDLAFKLADTHDVRSILVWCFDNARDALDRQRFAEALARHDAEAATR